MSSRVLSRLVVLVFMAVGLLATGSRYVARRDSRVAAEDSLWRLTYEISFVAKESGPTDAEASIRIGLPSSTRYTEVVNEEFIHPYSSLHVEDWQGASTGNREKRIFTRDPKAYRLTAEFDLRLRSQESWAEQSEFERLSPIARSRYLRSEDSFPVQSQGIRRVLQQTVDGGLSDGERLQALFDYCTEMRSVKDAGGDDVALAVASGQGQASALGRARVFVTLCRAAQMPARLVTGFELRQVSNPRPHVWAEVYRENRWVPFDPEYGYARHTPNAFVPIRRGGEEVVRSSGVEKLEAKFSIRRLPPPAEVLQMGVRQPWQIFDLTRLPVETHEVISLMLLLPFGALITAVFRNIVGIRTLGVFAPALLAMSFIYSAWGTGLILLAVVILVGLIGRTLLERLHLLMVPRQSIVLTVIIMCVVFGVSLINYLNPVATTQAVLLPLVILTILIERFFVTSEEDGMSFAVQLVLGTVVVAACCYLLLRWDDIGRLVLIFPETHFFTIAAFILIGRYTGYRLTELWRFHDLIKPDESQ